MWNECVCCCWCVGGVLSSTLNFTWTFFSFSMHKFLNRAAAETAFFRCLEWVSTISTSSDRFEIRVTLLVLKWTQDLLLDITWRYSKVLKIREGMRICERSLFRCRCQKIFGNVNEMWSARKNQSMCKCLKYLRIEKFEQAVTHRHAPTIC